MSEERLDVETSCELLFLGIAVPCIDSRVCAFHALLELFDASLTLFSSRLFSKTFCLTLFALCRLLRSFFRRKSFLFEKSEHRLRFIAVRAAVIEHRTRKESDEHAEQDCIADNLHTFDSFLQGHFS